MDYGVLRDEYVNDPAGRGYAGKTNQQVADLLNAKDQAVDRDVIDTWEILEATVQSEWTALSAAEKQRYQTVIGAGRVNVKGTNVRGALGAMFGVGTTTRVNLLALQTALKSRADIRGLPTVQGSDVAEMKRLYGL